MIFRQYDKLRLFTYVAQELSFTSTAEKLFMTKGAVSYQINQLESILGFDLFIRTRRGLELTDDGTRLWHLALASFNQLDSGIEAIQYNNNQTVVVGVTTYFAARWLSPRLTEFMQLHPDISIYLQPNVDMMNIDDSTDITIRWGNGDWNDMEIERLFYCPAFPCAGLSIHRQIQKFGLEDTVKKVTLLHDRTDSIVWKDWFHQAQLEWLPRHDRLTISDATMRVHAVIDGQGIAFYDELVEQELLQKKLFRIAATSLDNYGYFLAYRPKSIENPSVKVFRDWLLEQKC